MEKTGIYLPPDTLAASEVCLDRRNRHLLFLVVKERWLVALSCHEGGDAWSRSSRWWGAAPGCTLETLVRPLRLSVRLQITA